MVTLKNQVMDGLKWSIISKIFTQVFSWISTFMVIRILSPEDYGIIAIAMVFFSMIELFTNNGLISALVRQQERNRVKSNHIFTLSIGVNIFLSALLALSATYIADSYGNPKLADIFYVLAILNPLTSLTVVPSAHLQIGMDFKKKAFAETAAGLVGATVALVAANLGMAYWSLIYASIAMTLVRIAGYNYYAKSEYSLTLNFEGASTIYKFAINLQLGALVWFIYNRADTMIIGKYLGLEKLGVYNIGGEVASIPMTKFNSIINEVGFSAFSRSNHDPVAMSNYIKKALKIMGVLTYPVFFGISAVSEELIFIVLGDKWSQAAFIVTLLCLVMPIRMNVGIMANFAGAMGEAKFNFHNALATAVILISSIFYGVQHGLNKTAIAWVLGFSLSYLFLVIRHHNKFNLPLSTLLVFWPSFLISASMWLVIFIFEKYNNMLFGFELGIYWMFFAKIIIGCTIVLPLTIIIYGKELKLLLKKDT
jgi:O-antigen/teichoic acid export membrane protein